MEAHQVEGGETSVFEGDFESSAHCSAVSTATANAEKPGRKGKYALFFWEEVKGVVLNIHVTVATGLPKDTQIREPVPKRERVSNPHGASSWEPASFPLTLPPAFLPAWKMGAVLTTPPTSFNSGERTPQPAGDSLTSIF